MKHDPHSRMETILIQEPFRRIVRIAQLSPIIRENAVSGESYILTGKDKKRYKLRYCGRLMDAWRISRTVKRFPALFPKFYGREGRYLLFEWLDGKDLSRLKKEGHLDPEHFRMLGRICGEMHEIDEKGKPGKARKTFAKWVAQLVEKDILDKRQQAELLDLFEKKRSRIKHDFILEIHDLNIANYMVHPKTGKIVVVDEEGVAHKLKGSSIEHQFRKFWNREAQQAFLEGYREHHSDDYLTEDYLDFLKLYNLVRDVWVKYHIGRPYDQHLAKLREFLKKERE